MAVSAVASSTTSALLAATDSSRKGLVISNDDANTLYVLLGSGTASSSNYSFKLAQDQDSSIYDYTGEVNGVWSLDGTGSARVTTF